VVLVNGKVIDTNGFLVVVLCPEMFQNGLTLSAPKAAPGALVYAHAVPPSYIVLE
jgi:hypothetical protein